MTGDNGHRSASSVLTDPDVNTLGINEAELGHIETKLGELAACLTPDEAEKELKLRVEYISAENRSLAVASSAVSHWPSTTPFTLP